MDIIRPRLTDYHGIHKSQADLDFANTIFLMKIYLYM